MKALVYTDKDRQFGKIPGTSELQIYLCREIVEWTSIEKRSFSRQRIEARLSQNNVLITVKGIGIQEQSMIILSKIFHSYQILG